VCEDRRLFYKDEGRQDDEMMQSQGTRPNPNPAQKAGFVYKVKEKLPGCQTQTQTGQTQYKVKEMLPGCQSQSQTGQTQTGNSQTRSQTQTDQCKTGFHGLFDKKDEGRQDNEMMQNHATRSNPNPSQKAGLVYKVKETLPGCQIQTQTGQTQTQTQTGKTQTQTQIQTQTQTQTVQCKTGRVDKIKDKISGGRNKK